MVHEILLEAADVLSTGRSRLASPAVAAPLALWLRTDARRCKVDMAAWGSPKNALAFAEERYAGALGFARMVLGEAT